MTRMNTDLNSDHVSRYALLLTHLDRNFHFLLRIASPSPDASPPPSPCCKAARGARASETHRSCRIGTPSNSITMSPSLIPAISAGRLRRIVSNLTPCMFVPGTWNSSPHRHLRNQIDRVLQDDAQTLSPIAGVLPVKSSSTLPSSSHHLASIRYRQSFRPASSSSARPSDLHL